MEKITAVIVAAGSGTRMKADINKVFLPLDGEKTVIRKACEVFCECDRVSEIVVVTRECDIGECRKQLEGIKKTIKIVKGGASRQESVLNGLNAASDADIVAVHDGARPLILAETVESAISDAVKFGAAAVGVLCKDTIKITDNNGFIKETLDRSVTYQIQTPQIFKREEILDAHKRALSEGISATDDCALYERYFGKIKLTNGSYDNIKITTCEDLIIAGEILKKRVENK